MDQVQGIETVYIPEPDRGTLCISSQVGCAMDCTFCATAQQGFNRNLSAAEIVGQVWLAQRELALASRHSGRRAQPQDHQHRVHGHGRAARQLPQCAAGHADLPGRFGLRFVAPPGNLEHLGVGAADLQISAKNAMWRWRSPCMRRTMNCAMSWCRSTASTRSPNCSAACWHYIDQQNGRSITFEYVMLDGVNDKPEHARQLARLLHGRPAKLNLIPFNVFPGTRYRRSASAAIAQVSRHLE